MRIFHIPPRFLDTTTLYWQEHLIRGVFKKIAEARIDDDLTIKYRNSHLYLMFKLETISNELRLRGVKTWYSYKHYFVQLANEDGYDIDTNELETDKMLMLAMWDDERKPDVAELASLLESTSVEDLQGENDFMFSAYCEEYNL